MDAGAGTPCTTEELARERVRAEAAEGSADALRARLARKTEDAASLALRSKRHELRAQVGRFPTTSSTTCIRPCLRYLEPSDVRAQEGRFPTT